MKEDITMTLSRDAVLSRIRRKLAHDGERLVVSRGEKERLDLGECYIVNDRNVIVAFRCKPEGLARELGVLSGAEHLEEA